MSNIETAFVNVIVNTRAQVAELIYHLGMDNERNAQRLMNDIWAIHRAWRCLPILTWEIDKVDGFIREECAPAGVDIVKEWQRRLLAINIEDMEVIADYIS